MQDIKNIFFGNTPNLQRAFFTETAKYLLPNYPRIVIPAVGQFALVKCAIEAGYKKENIFTSDISLFSSILGYYFSGKSISLIDFKISEAYKPFYDGLNTEIERISFLLWLMKLKQKKSDLRHYLYVS